MQDSIILQGKMKYGCVRGVIEYGKMELTLNAPSPIIHCLGAGFYRRAKAENILIKPKVYKFG
jgi:hypothetical protein